MKIVTHSSSRQKQLRDWPQEPLASTGPYPRYPLKRVFGARRPGSLWGCNYRSPSGSFRRSRSLLLETPYLLSEVVSNPGRL
jgi:hypothetical protein